MQLTDDGKAKVRQAAERQNLSEGAAMALLDALKAGRGSQAQFNHPDLGGMGQWSRGGMIMIGDMFNNGLKDRVSKLADELSKLVGDDSVVAGGQDGAPAKTGSRWPAELGAPSSTGSQNDMHYAVFPDKQRLAVEQGGEVTVYDTGDHRISGASQQQGGRQTLAFSSQNGAVSVDDLKKV